MDIYELNIDGSDASELVFPIPEQKVKFIQLIEEKVSNGISAKDDWEEFIVLIREPVVNKNFYDIEDKGVYILDENTFDIINPALNSSVEVLPIKSDDQSYYLINVIEATDCLSKQHSDFTLLGDSQILTYKKLSFHLDKMTCPIFRIPEMPFTTLITQDLAELYLMKEWKGLHVSDKEYVGETL